MLDNKNPNIMELCFHNGEKHIKEKLIGKPQELGETMGCVTVAQMIKIVEDL